MQADYMVLADAVTSAEGKLFIHGAGWDTVLTHEWPANMTAGVGILLRMPWGETNEPHTFELDIIDADGRSVLPGPQGPLRGQVNVGRPPNLAPGEDQILPVAIGLNGTKIAQAGQYAVVFRIDGEERGRAPFKVQQAQMVQIIGGQQQGQPPAA